MGASSFPCMQLKNGLTMRFAGIAYHLYGGQRKPLKAAGGSVKECITTSWAFRALLEPEWFEKKGGLLPKAARPS
ncbi:hypothetical protein GBA52_027470 [Prunus armeniaca]|nr:hypothetical protein GBA52_027470 [Prunus armeniaca]